MRWGFCEWSRHSGQTHQGLKSGHVKFRMHQCLVWADLCPGVGYVSSIQEKGLVLVGV